MNKADKSKLAYIGKVPGNKRDSDSWFTPSIYVEAVRKTLGDIDLDPFSSKEANRIIKARKFFDLHSDALNKSWQAKTVFMNPPYSFPACKLAIAKFLSEHEKGAFSQGIVLCNNSTDSKWFHNLLATCDAFCLMRGRIAFWNVDGKQVSGNTRGQVFFYFGGHLQQFSLHFSAFGKVIRL